MKQQTITSNNYTLEKDTEELIIKLKHIDKDITNVPPSIKKITLVFDCIYTLYSFIKKDNYDKIFIKVPHGCEVYCGGGIADFDGYIYKFCTIRRFISRNGDIHIKRTAILRLPEID